MDRRSVAAVAALEDETRAALYAAVRSVEAPMTRDAAAAAVGISRKLAAFHLDKLVAAGLLQARIEGSGERRVGRKPKVYEPVPDAVSVHVPSRAPDLLAGILLDVVLDEPTAERAILAKAHERGVATGTDERARLRPGRLDGARALAAMSAVLDRHGFEPHLDGAEVTLRNCPFHPFAASAPAVVCGLNHAFLEGVVTGMGLHRSVTAELVPRDHGCCVTFSSTPRRLPGGRRSA